MTRPRFDLSYAGVEKKYDEAETARLPKRLLKRSMVDGHGFAPDSAGQAAFAPVPLHAPRLFVDGVQRRLGHRVKGHIACCAGGEGVHHPTHARMHAATNNIRSVEGWEATILGRTRVHLRTADIPAPRRRGAGKALPGQGQATRHEDPVHHYPRRYNIPDVDSRRVRQA